MALNLLLADPDEEWCLSMAKFFSEHLYKVDCASNGRDVQKLLYSKKYFSLILNFEIQNHSAMQVLKYVATHHKKIRAIVILEREHIKEDEELEEKLEKMGVDEIIIKPFSKDDLKRILEGHQSIGELMNSLPKRKGQSKEVEVEASESEYTSVSIADFYSLDSVLFDVYVKLGSGKFIKVLHMGDEFNRERLDHYKDKGVECLYFHKSDRMRYVKFNNHLASKLVNNTKVKTRSKLKLLRNVMDKFIEDSYDEGVKPVVLEQGKQICENIYTFIQNSNDLHKHFQMMLEFDPDAFEHSYLVTLFSSAMIKQFEWESKTMIQNTALACMFHDIGKMKVDREILDKSRSDLTDEELEIYQQHPVFGVDQLAGVKDINFSTKQIILQHHEAYDGTGYPHGLKGAKILTLANIVACADSLIHTCKEHKCTPVNALKFLLKDEKKVSKFNSQVTEKLIHVFVDPVKLAGLKKTKAEDPRLNTLKRTG